MTQSQVRIGWRAYVGTTTIASLLETYPGAAAAYSLRRLATGATASIRVRRSSDNQETDIGFTSAGDLNTAALLAFTGNLNAISYSQDFDNAVWNKYGSTVAANSDIAPDGTMTADKMTEDTSNGWHGIYRYINQTVNSGVSWNSSFYAKKASDNTMSSGQNVLVLRQSISGMYSESVGYFDLDTGIATFDVGSSSAQAMNALGATMSNEGNGWWRCSLWGTNTATNAKTLPTTIVRKSGSNQTFAGNTGAKFLLWGFRYYSTNNTSGLALEPYTSTGNGYGGDAFVSKWYDQSGNGRHATQTSAISQPNIVKQKAVTMNGGKPSIKINNSVYDGMYPQGLRYNYGSMNLSATFSLFTVSKFDTMGNVIAVGGDLYSPYSPLWLNSIINSKFAHYSGGYVYGDAPNTNTNLHYLLNNSGSVTMGRNGGNNYYGSNTAMSGTNALQGISIGAGSFTPYVTNQMTGDIQEVVLYNSEKSLATRAEIESNINSYYSIYTPQSSDADAQAFIATAGLTSSTHISALSTLVTSLKASISVGSTQSLWAKMKAIYPFVGGSANAHQFNLKDPRNLDAAYRLGFMGGMTHTSLGAVPNGSNAYAKTFLTPSVALTSSQHVSFYSMTDRGSTIAPTSNEAELGAMSGGTGIPGIMLALNSRAHNSNNSNHYLTRLSGGGYGSYGLTPLTDTRGFALLSRTDLNSVKAFWNGSYYGQTAQSYIALPLALTMFYAHYSNSYSFKTCGFATIGDGLNEAESTALYGIIQAYQTTLGRQV